MSNTPYTTCAKIDENSKVTQVIICRSVHWARTKLGGHWEPVYDGCPTGVGYTWDGTQYIPPILEEDLEEEEL